MIDSLPSSSTQPEPHSCALCTTPARYKCPRCAAPTCSLPCSRKHKQFTGCTGERDKAQYVPMGAYGWGTMMRDYCYLEEVGRKVSEWGNDIVRGGYSMENSGKKGAKGRGEGRRPPTGKRKPTTAKSKRDLLRAHLEMLGIDVELLPTGMERRNMNQSTFDQRSRCPLLTIEFVFHPPTTFASPPPSHTILSHRNELSVPLLEILRRQVSSSLSKSQKQKENTFPDWIPPIVHPHPEAPETFLPPHCYLGAHVEFPHAPNATYYHRLDPTVTLSELLRRTSFVEFPSIHVFDPEASSFLGIVIDKSGSIAWREDEGSSTRVVKRRKLSKESSRKAIANLVGGYGSESGSPSEGEGENKSLVGLATLEAYADSNDEESPTNVEVEDNSEDIDDVTSGSETEGARLDPARLLELVKQARVAADEDVLDWGDEWDVDAEG